MDNQVLIQFLDTEDNPLSDPIQVPTTISHEHLIQILPEQVGPTTLYVHGHQIITSLNECIKSINISHERTIPIKTVREAPSSKPAIFCSSSFSGHEQAVLKVKIYKNKCITSGGDGTVRIWDISTKFQTKIIKVSDHWVGCLDVCEEFIVSGCMSGCLSIIKWNDDYQIQKIKNHDGKGVSGVKIGYIGNDPFIVSGGRDGKVNIISKNGEFISSYSHTGPVDDIEINDDFIVTAGRDRKIKIYQKSTSKENIKPIKEFRNHTLRINCIKISGDVLATGSDDHKVYLYSIKNNFKLIKELTHKNVVTSLDFSDNNMFIATCGFDKMVRVWDIQSGNLIHSYFHVGPVYKVIFNSNLVISISKDKTVKNYCIKNKKLISDLVCGDEIFDVDYKNGKMVCGCRDRKVYFFG